MRPALIHADRRADMTKLMGAFRNYANAPKKHTAFRTLHLRLSSDGMRKEDNNSGGPAGKN